MKTLIFGTSNPNKIQEINKLIPSSISVKSMQEMGVDEELPEDQDTIAGNAMQKVRHLYSLVQQNCFAEDTGLIVNALDGAPGVYSARFSGPDSTSEKNINKLLRQLKGEVDRKAHFLTVIALHWEGGYYTFEGIVEGSISEQICGDGGFGYDPVFIPAGYEKSFGELPMHVKNQISHRSRAVSKLVNFLKRNS